ncbi:hypothetical protein LguiB_001327 [Lonicera macranthoides]
MQESKFITVSNDETTQQNPRLRMYAEYQLRMMKQLNSTYYVERTCEEWFCASSNAWGLRTFVLTLGSEQFIKGHPAE